jgi:hypothetical protein
MNQPTQLQEMLNTVDKKAGAILDFCGFVGHLREFRAKVPPRGYLVFPLISVHNRCCTRVRVQSLRYVRLASLHTRSRASQGQPGAPRALALQVASKLGLKIDSNPCDGEFVPRRVSALWGALTVESSPHRMHGLIDRKSRSVTAPQVVKKNRKGSEQARILNFDVERKLLLNIEKEKINKQFKFSEITGITAESEPPTRTLLL